MRLRHLTLTSTLTCALLGGAGVPAAAARPAPAPPVRGDFNGDGYADLAAGMPDASAAGRTGAGRVSVVWGGPRGLGAHGSADYGQDSPGVPGTAETGDHFGHAVAPGDLNGDGYADLAVSAPDETLDTPGASHQGAVYVLWGSARGLTSGTTTAKGSHDDARIGGLLDTGDYDHDGHGDLVLDTTGDETSGILLRRGPQTAAATPATVRGWHFSRPAALTTADFDGDGRDDLAVTYGGSEDQGTFVASLAAGAWTTSWSTGDHGSALAAGDFDGDRRTDLAIGLVVPNSETERTDCPKDRTGGAVAVVTGAPGTVLGGAADCTTQDTPGVGGAAEPEDDFGAALATVHGTGRDSLLVGVPHEAVGTRRAAGAYALLGTAPGSPLLTGAPATQNTARVAGTAETGDRFGTAVAAADFDGDGHADAAIGTPGENGATGGVWYRPAAQPPFPDTVAVTPARLGLTGAVRHGAVLGR
ncbi:FG-GAP-like repeat-containing protein [Streptomyces sp. NPDC088785]|uniref:FG-GAP-like repeat-containing protein n=1 Tax=Streptomyces sp. NPDC088785 TaxID=3365897 RepID=UPI00380F4417